MIGIYAIKNLKNGKMYIGQSVNVTDRLKSHIADLSKNIHVNRTLQDDFNENENYIVCGIIRECEMYSLDVYEQEAILNYNTIEHGYNTVIPKIRENSLSDFIYDVNIDIYEKTTMIKLATAYSLNSASKLTKGRPQDIKRCCELKRRTISNKYITLYQSTSIDEYRQFWKKKDTLQTGEQRAATWAINNGKYIDALRESKKYALIQYDLDMNIVAEYDIITDIPDHFNKKYVRRALSGERSHHAGYIWKYKTHISKRNI